MTIFALPVPTAQLAPYLPHRDPMIWVDEVVSVDEQGGTCKINVDPDAQYFGPDGIRETAPVEWMAQAYGFVKAVQVANGIIKIAALPKVTFLAQVRDLKTEGSLNDDEFFVEVKLKRALGPMNLVDGIVRNSRSELVASANLKLFAQ